VYLGPVVKQVVDEIDKQLEREKSSGVPPRWNIAAAERERRRAVKEIEYGSTYRRRG